MVVHNSVRSHSSDSGVRHPQGAVLTPDNGCLCSTEIADNNYSFGRLRGRAYSAMLWRWVFLAFCRASEDDQCSDVVFDTGLNPRF